MSEKQYSGITGYIVFRISYQNMFTNVVIETEPYKNIVVNSGRTLILNRLVNATYDAISYIGVGTGTADPALNQTALGNERSRKSATVTVTSSSPNFNIKFSANYTSSEINGVTEIGLFNAATSGTMVTRTTFSAISIPDGTMTINYYLSLNTGKQETTWTKTAGKTYTYQSYQPVTVNGVIELNTGNGYVKKTNVNDVEATPASYYYDSGAKLLYIRTSNSLDPSNHTILVLSTN